MINFKDFLSEQVSTTLKQIQFLPLYQGHDGIAAADTMLNGIDKTLKGKKTDIKTQVQLPGLPVTFGVNPQSKKFFVSHGGVDTHSPEEVDLYHGGNAQVASALKVAHNNLRKILPKEGGMWNGQVLYTDKSKIPSFLPKSNANMGIAVQSNHEGKLLTNGQKAKFQIHPDVYNINASLRGVPERYHPYHQHDVGMNLTAARQAYSKLDPEAFDTINGHQSHLQNYIVNLSKQNAKAAEQAKNVKEAVGSKPSVKKPSIEEYSKFLASQCMSKTRGSDPYKKAKIMDKYSKLSAQLFDNTAHFKHVLDVIHPLHQVATRLAQVASYTGNPGDVHVFHGDNTAVLRQHKN